MVSLQFINDDRHDVWEQFAQVISMHCLFQPINNAIQKLHLLHIRPLEQ